jgi:cytochrome P450
MMSSSSVPPYRLNPAGGSPHADNARLLARGAVAPVVLPGEVEGMAVLGHEALKDFLSRADVAKDPRHFAALHDGRIPAGWPLRTFATVRGMTTADGADHRRLRSLVSKAFTARRVELLRPRVEAMTSDLLDGLERAAEDGVVDLIPHFALPLPIGVIGELLGIDDEYRDMLHRLSDRVVATDAGPEEVMTANREMAALLGTVAAARAERPGDDLTSALIAARDEDGDRLSQEELIGTLLLMVVAGHETTLALIANAVRALCAHRDQLDLVTSGEANWSDAVEETLRWDAPVSFFPFRASRTSTWPARSFPTAPVSSATACVPFRYACEPCRLIEPTRATEPGRSGSQGRLAGGHDLADVRLGPVGDGLDRGLQGHAERGQGVLHARRDLGEHLAGDEAVALHRAQGLGEDLRGHAADLPAQLGEPPWPVAQGDHDQRGPPVADAVEHQPRGAVRVERVSHLNGFHRVAIAL